MSHTWGRRPGECALDKFVGVSVAQFVTEGRCSQQITCQLPDVGLSLARRMLGESASLDLFASGNPYLFASRKSVALLSASRYCGRPVL